MFKMGSRKTIRKVSLISAPFSEHFNSRHHEKSADPSVISKREFLREESTIDNKGFCQYLPVQILSYIIIIIIFFSILGVVMSLFMEEGSRGAHANHMATDSNADFTKDSDSSCSANSFLLNDGVCDEVRKMN